MHLDGGGDGVVQDVLVPSDAVASQCVSCVFAALVGSAANNLSRRGNVVQDLLVVAVASTAPAAAVLLLLLAVAVCFAVTAVAVAVVASAVAAADALVSYDR